MSHRTVTRRRPFSQAMSVCPSETVIEATDDNGTGWPSAEYTGKRPTACGDAAVARSTFATMSNRRSPS